MGGRVSATERNRCVSAWRVLLLLVLATQGPGATPQGSQGPMGDVKSKPCKYPGCRSLALPIGDGYWECQKNPRHVFTTDQLDRR